MATRSVTLIDDIIDDYQFENGDYVRRTRRVPVARFYRHFDGYPEGHGADIVDAIKKMRGNDRLNNHNWLQHFLCALCAEDMDIEFEPATPDAGSFVHGDLNYLYRVTGRMDYTGGKESAPDIPDRIIIDIWAVRYGDDEGKDYANILSTKPLMSGTWSEIESMVRPGA